MWFVIEKANSNEVRCGGFKTVRCGGFKTVEEACVFIINGGAHNFEWVGNKVTYQIIFEG